MPNSILNNLLSNCHAENVSKQLRCHGAHDEVRYVLVLALYFDGHVLEKTLHDNEYGKHVMGYMCRGHPRGAAIQTAIIVAVT